MILKINFHDHDFSVPITEACAKFMYEITNGYEGLDAEHNYFIFREKYSLEDIKLAIIRATYGILAANYSVRLYLKNDKLFNASEIERLFQYFNENFELTELKDFNKKWENSEVVYIDFFNNTVTLQ